MLEFAKRKRRVQQLIQNLRSSEPADRVHAVKQLAVIGADVEDAVPALSNALQDDNERVRLSAVVALGRIGADAKDAIPALINALQDDIDDVRSFALPLLCPSRRVSKIKKQLKRLRCWMRPSQQFEKLTRQPQRRFVGQSMRYDRCGRTCGAPESPNFSMGERVSVDRGCARPGFLLTHHIARYQVRSGRRVSWKIVPAVTEA